MLDPADQTVLEQLKDLKKEILPTKNSKYRPRTQRYALTKPNWLSTKQT
jgi:hypothetical protein